MKKLIISTLIVTILWFVMFSPWTAPHLNFWAAMSVSGIVLMAISFFAGRTKFEKTELTFTNLLIGVVTAATLWGVFWLGNFLSTRWFGFAQGQIDSIYEMKNDNNSLIIGALLLFVIGPAEEIFWRGYFQRSIDEICSKSLRIKSETWRWLAPVLVTAFVYAVVHVFSFNFMLIMAALVCGLFWGFMFRFTKSVVPLIVCHALWDVSVFILFPISN